MNQSGYRPLSDVAMATLEIQSKAHDRILWLEKEVSRLGAAHQTELARAELAENQVAKLKFALMNSEKGSPLNENDEAMLINNGVTLEFTRKPREGAKIVARRKGRKLARADGDEGSKILYRLMVDLRRYLRGRGE